ncbi:unnamed protein product [Rhizopus stolonifer]
MSLYNISTELKTHPHPFYPFPPSPGQETCTEQALNISIQDNYYCDDKDWIVATTPLDYHSIHDVHTFNSCNENSETSDSSSSSLGMSTPDIGLFDIANASFNLSHRPSFEYIPLLQSPITSQSMDLENYDSKNHLYPCLYMDYMNTVSNGRHMTLLQKDYPELIYANRLTASDQQTISLCNLSKQELIDRVIQLETERFSRQTTKKSSEKPIRKEKNSNQMFSCNWVSCDSQATTLEKLMTHICNTHIGSGKATYYCEWQDCSRKKKPFMKRHKMHNHMRTHTGERPFVCNVMGCNKTFSRPDSLSTHIKTHSDNRPYLCPMPECGKAYYHSRSLRKHIKSLHVKISKSDKKFTASFNTTYPILPSFT